MNPVSLSCGDWKAVIVPEYAMNVIFLTFRDDPVLHGPAKPELLEKDPFIYGTPLLLPPDVMEKNTFFFDGKTYTLSYEARNGKLLALHGHLFDAPMIVTERSGTAVTGEFLCGEDRYPFPFRLTVTCRLTEEGLTQRYRFENTGHTAMPLLFGLHTTFAAKDRFSVSIDKAWRRDPNTGMPEKLTALSAEQMAYRTGASPQGDRIHGFFSDSGAHCASSGQYRYRVSDNFRQWVVWNMHGHDGLISLEPLSGAVNGLNMEGQSIRLEPGEQELFETQISHESG